MRSRRCTNAIDSRSDRSSVPVRQYRSEIDQVSHRCLRRRYGPACRLLPPQLESQRVATCDALHGRCADRRANRASAPGSSGNRRAIAGHGASERVDRARLAGCRNRHRHSFQGRRAGRSRRRSGRARQRTSSRGVSGGRGCVREQQDQLRTQPHARAPPPFLSRNCNSSKRTCAATRHASRPLALASTTP
jgi:hypothetical protein